MAETDGVLIRKLVPDAVRGDHEVLIEWLDRVLHYVRCCDKADASECMIAE